MWVFFSLHSPQEIWASHILGKHSAPEQHAPSSFSVTSSTGNDHGSSYMSEEPFNIFTDIFILKCRKDCIWLFGSASLTSLTHLYFKMFFLHSQTIAMCYLSARTLHLLPFFILCHTSARLFKMRPGSLSVSQ